MSNSLRNSTLSTQQVKTLRTSMITGSVIGILLGVILLVWPGITLLLIALFFGVALILAGVFRVVAALTAPLQTGFRILLGALGVLMGIAGVLCLARPIRALLFVAIMIGLAWIFDGVYHVVLGLLDRSAGPRWWAIVGGVISLIAGVIVLVIPGLALSTFATFGGILLVVVSIVTLTSLPGKAARR